ncbi:MAG: hemolysin family protein [Ignavibacteria bacterium]|nr:hemolysin family protein [Ignavibacteria bacterium]
MVFNIFLTLFLVFLNAFFVAAEFAIVKVRNSTINIRARKGSFTAKVASHIINNLNEYLSACQLGITIASLGLGWIGEPVVSKILLWLFGILGFDVTKDFIEGISLPLAFVIITILHIILGELAPKALAIVRAEQTALLTSLPLRLFYLIFKPFIWFLNKMANLTLLPFGIRVVEQVDTHSVEEIREILKESSKLGAIEETEEKLIQKVFEFSGRTAKQIMVPRGKIVGIKRGLSFREVLEIFVKEGFSRMPVYETTIDEVVGILYAKDILALKTDCPTGEEFSWEKYLRKPLFVHEDTKIQNILKEMQKNKIHIAIVYDDFGGTSGLVSIEDILEEIVGEIHDEYDEEITTIRRITDEVFEIDAETSIEYLNKHFGLNLPTSDDYETIGGFISSNFGRIPKSGERLDIDGLQWEILNSTERKILTIRLTITKK